MKWIRFFPLMVLLLFLVACSNGKVNLNGEWDASGSDGVASSWDFKDNELLTMDFGAMKFTYEWQVENSQLRIIDKKDGEVRREYVYEFEQESRDNVTLYELDEEENRVEGSTIKLSKK
ncbi:MAG: hypothetical protein RR651_13895 [Lysinibacillus sp.]